MGLKFFDKWTIGHFIFGIIATMTIYPENPLFSLIIANIFHLIMELIEKNYDPKYGFKRESLSNHLGDILFFFIGTIIGLYFVKYTLKNKTLKLILFFILVVSFFHDIFIELIL